MLSAWGLIPWFALIKSVVMAGERLITFNAYYLLIFQISLIILIIFPRQLFFPDSYLLWKVELPFSLVHILLRIFSALREKKRKKKERNPEVKIQLLKRKQRWRILITWHFSACNCHSSFFRIFAFSSTLTRERIFETVWGVGNLLCDTLTCVVWFYTCSSHFPNCVYADCERQKKKKNEGENDAFDLCC